MALQPAAMFKQNESTNNQQQLHEARCQSSATDCSRAPSSAAAAPSSSAANQTNSLSSSSSSSSSSSLSLIDPSLAHSSSQAAPSSPPPSSRSFSSRERNQREQQASLAAAAAAMATQERLALLLHQQQQQLQEQRSFEARAPSTASSTGSFEEPEEDSLARRLALFRDFEAMDRSRRQQGMEATSDEVDNSSGSTLTNQMQLDSGEQEMALNLSVSKSTEPREPKPDLTQNLFKLHNEQSWHSQLERQQLQFQEVNSRLYEHLLAYQARTSAADTGTTGKPKGLHQTALSPTGSSTSSSGAASPPPAGVSLAHLLQTHNNRPGFSNPNQHHPCYHHQSSTSSSHHSHSSSASSSSSSGAADSLTGYSPTNDRPRHHFTSATSSGCSSSSSSASANCQQTVEQMSPAAAAAAAQRLHQHLLNFNSDPANRLLLNQKLHGPQDRSTQLHAQSTHHRDLSFSSHHDQPHLHNNLMSNLHLHNNQNHPLLLAGLGHQQQLAAAAGKTRPMLQHELGPVHKTDSDDLDRIRNFIEQFKARRGALGLTQKQAAQCFRAYTNDRYAFSDNFVGHFEGFQFRPQTAMTIADSLAEWLEFAELETRQGRQLSFMPGKVKETRKRKYEVIRIRDSAKRVLVEAFEKNRSPSTSELEQLSKRTNIPSRNIEIFFKNRRTSRQYHH